MGLTRYSASLRVRVAIAAATAAAAVVGMLVLLSSVVLTNNDQEQLDRRLDAIIDASTGAGPDRDPSRTVLSTGRAVDTGQVVFQRGLQLPRPELGHF